jgi:hypothetical protein
LQERATDNTSVTQPVQGEVVNLPEIPDSMYSLPQFVSESTPDLVETFNVLLVRLQREMSESGCNTLDYMLMERDLNNYIILKWRERRATGQAGGFEHTTAAKDFNSFWLGTHKELNARMSAKSPEDIKAGVVALHAKGLEYGLAKLDAVTAERVRRVLSSAFAEVGL